MKNKIMILLSILFILILIISTITIFNKPKETILETFTLNKQSLMRSDKTILDEQFDENGNLIYYKYQSSTDNTISEFYYKYEYDNNNRITEISLNDRDNIKIKYNEENKIAEINEITAHPLYNRNDYFQFSFNYLSNDELNVTKIITNYDDEKNKYTQHYTLNYKTINYNNKNCILITETDDYNSITETIYEKGLNEINYSNFYDLINIIPLGYYKDTTKFKISQSNYNSILYTTPIFYNGNMLYKKYHLQTDSYSNSIDETSSYYYDKLNRLLKIEIESNSHLNSTCNYMYKSINSREYYEYKIEKTSRFEYDIPTEYTYTENKVYLDDNNTIIKIEKLKEDKISEKEYNSKLKKFEKYFNKEKI